MQKIGGPRFWSRKKEYIVKSRYRCILLESIIDIASPCRCGVGISSQRCRPTVSATCIDRFQQMPVSASLSLTLGPRRPLFSSIVALRELSSLGLLFCVYNMSSFSRCVNPNVRNLAQPQRIFEEIWDQYRSDIVQELRTGGGRGHPQAFEWVKRQSIAGFNPTLVI